MDAEGTLDENAPGPLQTSVETLNSAGTARPARQSVAPPGTQSHPPVRASKEFMVQHQKKMAQKKMSLHPNMAASSSHETPGSTSGPDLAEGAARVCAPKVVWPCQLLQNRLGIARRAKFEPDGK